VALTWLVTLVVVSNASAHSRIGVYQNMATAPREWQTPYPLVRGVPMVDYGSFQARNPVTAAQYGLASWSLWRRYHDPPRVVAAIRVADWLLATQHPDGKWTYHFDYASPGTTMALDAPWGSALAQGQGISLLRRAYAHTGKRRYLRAARAALAPLRRSVTRGGLARWHDGGIVFEEYPSERPSLPLNGHLQTLIGLYDLADVSPRAEKLFHRGVRTAARIVPEYDAGGGWSLYNLVHQVGFAPVATEPSYHVAHVRLLRLLNRLSPHRAFRRWAARWKPVAAAGRIPPTATP
jgi:heparosan-N-sulfate-glucuronate 5-epimerase